MERISQLATLLTKEPSLAIDIAASILARGKRTFTADSERLAAKFEKPVVLGSENIPNSPNPTIVACNHPNVYELAAGAVNITSVFAMARKEAGLPGTIRWIAGQNFVSVNPNVLVQKVVYPTMNKALRVIHQTYDFIPVPINYLDPKKQIRERAIALAKARKNLEEHPYSAIGIFPEAGFESNDQMLDFYGGVGVLCRIVKAEVVVLPTAIYRGTKSELIVSFGQTMRINPENSGDIITAEIKEAINALKNRA